MAKKKRKAGKGAGGGGRGGGGVAGRRSPDAGLGLFDRFRRELKKYQDGVHLLGEPAGPLGAAVVARLPAEFRAFVQSWNGAELFNEAYRVCGVGASAVGGDVLQAAAPGPGGGAAAAAGQAAGEGDDDGAVVFPAGALEIAAAAEGARFALATDGRVLRWDPDDEAVVPEASGLERWLGALMVREGLLYDAEGEFIEGAFEGDAVAPELAIAGERKALVIDPEAMGPRLRLARALREQGKRDDMLIELERLLELERARVAAGGSAASGPGLPAWALHELARLRWALADRDDALELADQVTAAAGPASAGEAAVLAAQAATWAAARERPALVKQLSERARALSPDVVTRLRDAGAYQVESGDVAAAKELLEAAKLLAPRDLTVLELLRRARAGKGS
ncbi:MAG: hypothetical protein IT370_07640 [Deltaproteobacteria bacterium]|nr:hypothetical protein [Deltaproteobacteria bacterium]